MRTTNPYTVELRPRVVSGSHIILGYGGTRLSVYLHWIIVVPTSHANLPKLELFSRLLAVDVERCVLGLEDGIFERFSKRFISFPTCGELIE
jgi:hypothetical protein